MDNFISNKKYKLIEFTRRVLDVSNDHRVTEKDITEMKITIENYINIDNLSPSDIKRKYNIVYTDFGMFLKNCIGIKLKSTRDAVNNYFNTSGRSITDEKLLYKKNCKFKFNPFSISKIPGHNLLKSYGIYNSVSNQNGVDRDHMISVEYGWRNNIDPIIISHPANCQFLIHIDNMVKNSSCSISLECLKDRISNWETNLVISDNLHLSLPKTQEHKDKIRISNAGYIRITNESENIRIKSTDAIPVGFRKGFTRKNKMVD